MNLRVERAVSLVNVADGAGRAVETLLHEEVPLSARGREDAEVILPARCLILPLGALSLPLDALNISDGERRVSSQTVLTLRGATQIVAVLPLPDDPDSGATWSAASVIGEVMWVTIAREGVLGSGADLVLSLFLIGADYFGGVIEYIGVILARLWVC